MSQNITADERIDIEHAGETLAVPTTFARSDLSAWYGDVPDDIRVDRIFVYDSIVRAEQQGVPWVEVGHFSEDDFKPGTDTGWVAEELDINPTEIGEDGPGETLWVRE